MKQLLIIGAGGFGREMYGAARTSVGFGTDFVIRGFLDARADALSGFSGYPPVLGDPATYVPAPDDVFVTALGDIASRRRCAQALEEKGAEFVAIVHKTAYIGPNVTIAPGAFIAPNAVLTADIRIGRHASVFHGSSIGHDTVLGDCAHVYAQCSLGGSVRVGEGARVFPGSVIVPRRTIGANATVGAGSTVIIDVAEGDTVFGNPAASIGSL